ncbi:MAG: dihydroorotate dehydrogenase-like protein [Cyclobacteriaceae bacterium]
MIDLTTKYMGLSLNSPVVVSACTLSEDPDNIVRMEDAGAGAVVLFSLFEEQIKKEQAAFDNVQETTNDNFAEALSYFPEVSYYRVGSERYLDIIREASERVNIPIIGSLNGTTDEGWIEYALQMEQAGANGIELNIFYIPADLELSGVGIEKKYLEVLQAVKTKVTIPVALKLSPYFSAMGNICKRFEEAGADGLVLFNRFYQPDFDIESLKVVSSLKYSSATEIRLPLLWIATLFGRIKPSLAATTGVQGAKEVIKYLLAGADVVMTASALYKHGINHVTTMNKGLEEWMESFNFNSIVAFKGLMSQLKVADPTAFNRANYIKILESSR